MGGDDLGFDVKDLLFDLSDLLSAAVDGLPHLANLIRQPRHRPRHIDEHARHRLHRLHRFWRLLRGRLVPRRQRRHHGRHPGPGWRPRRWRPRNYIRRWRRWRWPHQGKLLSCGSPYTKLGNPSLVHRLSVRKAMTPWLAILPDGQMPQIQSSLDSDHLYSCCVGQSSAYDGRSGGGALVMSMLKNQSEASSSFGVPRATNLSENGYGVCHDLLIQRSCWWLFVLRTRCC